MPSLSALEKFKSSFLNIGNQASELAAKGIPFDDLEMPESEPELMSDLAGDGSSGLKNENETPQQEPDIFPFEEVAASSPTQSEPPVSLDGDLDFSAFLAAAPGVGGLEPEPGPDAFSITDFDESPPTEDSGQDAEEQTADTDDFYISPEIAEAEELFAEDFYSQEGLQPETDAPGFFEENVAEADGSLGIEGLDDFALPEMPETAEAAEDFNFDDFNVPDFSAESETENAAEAGGDLDIEGLDDFALPEMPDAAEAAEDFNFDDFSVPDFSAEGETENAAEAGGDLDIEGLDDFALPEMPDTAEAAEDFNFDDFSVPDFSAESGAEDTAESGGDLDIEGLDDFALPEITDTAEDAEDFNFDDFNVPDFSMESGTEDAAEAGEGLDNFSLPEMSDATEAEAGDSDFEYEIPPEAWEEDSSLSGETADDVNDLFGSFDPSEKIASDTIPSVSASDENDFDGLSFPELDKVPGLSAALKESPVMAKGKTSSGLPNGRGWTKPTAPMEELETIELTDSELDKLQNTLSSYPLNLRIACQEIISEQIVNPMQMAQLLRMLVRDAHPKATASLAGEILGKTITIPKSFEKKTGAELEEEQSTFAYIFVHNFLPILRLFLVIAVTAGCLFYLIYTFVYRPMRADSIYRAGLERIYAGEYQRAVERFWEAFAIHPRRNWFFTYAEAFIEQRQFAFAARKYEALLTHFPRDRRGVLDFAAMETNFRRNYARADELLRRNLLDFNPNDIEALLALGDNNLAWGEIEPGRLADARFAFARVLDLAGWTPPVVERMLRYFIRTDNLREVNSLRQWFDADPRRRPLSAVTMAELGGYLLDKQLEETRGVPDFHIGQIESVLPLLLNAYRADPSLPEAHYHLARYFHSLRHFHEERIVLQRAVEAFNNAPEESIRRIRFRIDTHRRFADALIRDREFIPAEENLIRGIGLYQNAIARGLIQPSPYFGRLFAGLGDLEYFAKTGDMEAALRNYRQAEAHGWAPPEMLYRMGAAYYQLEDWGNALERLFAASADLPLNRRVLFALGNASFKQGNFFAAQGYYNRLLDILEVQRARLPMLLPNDRPDFLELAERLMMAQNNAGAAYEMLAAQTGNPAFRNRSMVLYSQSQLAWDSFTRDPRTMVRSGATPLPFLNMRNALHPQADIEPQIFIRIDRDAMENSFWEELVPIVWD